MSSLVPDIEAHIRELARRKALIETELANDQLGGRLRGVLERQLRELEVQIEDALARREEHSAPPRRRWIDPRAIEAALRGLEQKRDRLEVQLQTARRAGLAGEERAIARELDKVAAEIAHVRAAAERRPVRHER